MRTEVCVVAYNSDGTLPALVDSLRLMGPDVGLAVHDNGPGASSLAVAQSAAARAGVPIRTEVCGLGNCGFGVACNALAAGSTAEDLLFLNPDARVLSWPDGLTAGARVVGASVVDVHGVPLPTYGVGRRLRDEVALRWLRRPPGKPNGQGYVSGAALLIGRDRFRALGGFDASYFMYYEDIDLCHRAVAAGLTVVVDERWRVEHLGGHSVGRTADGLRTAHLRSYRSGRRYHERHGHAVRGYDLMCLLDAAARAALRAPVPSRRGIAGADWAVARAAAWQLVGRQG